MSIIINKTGNCPLLITVGHNGKMRKNLKPRTVKKLHLDPDKYLNSFSSSLITQMEEDNIIPYYIIFNIKRRYVDVNRPINVGTESENQEKYWKIYHNKIKQYINNIVKRFGKCLLIDLHTNTKTKKEIQLGYGLDNIYIDSNNYDNSTIKNLADNINISEKVLILGNQSLGHLISKKKFKTVKHIKCVPSPKHTINTKLYYNGGYTSRKYSKVKNCSSIQIEISENLLKEKKNIKDIANILSECLINFTRIHVGKEIVPKYKKKIVGIITVPLSPGRKYYKICGDSYISSSHINWLRNAGLETFAIPYNTKNHKYYFERINGLYIPSGGVFASNSKNYYNCCKKFIKLSIKANDNGDYFPIWGACMGFQQMLIVSEKKDNLKDLLTKFDSFKDYLTNFETVKDSKESRILKNISKKFLNNIKNKKLLLHNHSMGLSLYKYNKITNIKNFYRIVSVNKDRNGKIFLSTIEARNYPFYGVQWHPERSDDMNEFAIFFKNEVEKNGHSEIFNFNDKLFTKKINCMIYSNNIYNYCNFYWHNLSSSHNKKLCNQLHLGSATSNRI